MTDPAPWIDQRFHDLVRPVVFARAVVSDRPVWITVGGQPGAGKTAAQAKAQNLNPGASVTPIIGDDLRRFHPDYEALLDAEPLAMPTVTAEASGAWIRASLDHAREQGYGVLVESTFRQSQVTLDTAASFHEAGYTTHVVAVAVAAWESRLSTLERFVTDHAAGRVARWTPLQAHEAGLAGTPRTLAAAAASPAVDRISVITRSGEVLFDDTRPGPLTGARSALDREQHRRPARHELRDWVSRLDTNLDYLARAIPATAETQAITRALRSDHRQLVDGTYHPAANTARPGPTRTATPSRSAGPRPN